MRILVLNQYFAPDRSATAQLLTELCEDLTEAGHHVQVVSGRPSYNPESRTRSKGVLSRERHGKVGVTRVWSTSFHRGGMGGRLTNYGTYLVTSSVGAMSAGRPDVVLTWTDPPPIGLVGALAGRLRHVPLVVTMQDVFPEVALRVGVLDNPAVIRVLRRIRTQLFRRARRVVAIGRDQRSRLVSLGVPEAKIEVIPNWSDGSLVRPLRGGSEFRRQMGWTERFVVMHSGNVGLSQDLETIVRAADHLKAERDVVFAIVGDGASRPSLEREVRARALTNVTFLPYQPRLSLADSLGAADIHLVGLRRGLAGFIVPSKVYGIMAAAKPFIAAVEAGSEPALIAEEHGCGVRIEPGDSRALAEEILRLRGEDLERMGIRGRAAFEALYDRPKATGAYARLLESLT